MQGWTVQSWHLGICNIPCIYVTAECAQCQVCKCAHTCWVNPTGHFPLGAEVTIFWHVWIEGNRVHKILYSTFCAVLHPNVTISVLNIRWRYCVAEQQESIYTVLFTKYIFGALKRKVKPFSAWRLTQQTQGGSKNATHRLLRNSISSSTCFYWLKKLQHKLKMKKEKLKHIETDSWGHHNAFPSSKKELV